MKFIIVLSVREKLYSRLVLIKRVSNENGPCASFNQSNIGEITLEHPPTFLIMHVFSLFLTHVDFTL